MFDSTSEKLSQINNPFNRRTVEIGLDFLIALQNVRVPAFISAIIANVGIWAILVVRQIVFSVRELRA